MQNSLAVDCRYLAKYLHRYNRYINPQRESFASVILDNHFKASLKQLNPTLPESARVEAYQKVINLGTLDIMENNERFHSGFFICGRFKLYKYQRQPINKNNHIKASFVGLFLPLFTFFLALRCTVKRGDLTPCSLFNVCITKRGKNKPTKDIINFNLLSDGIHPSPLLAKVWLKEISIIISVD
jgi:hypothetical protein